MRLPIPIILLLTACSGQPPASAPPVTHELRDDLAHLFSDQLLNGSFIGYDAHAGRWLFIDSALCDSATLPASTFKILGTLIGLESGALPDAEHVIAWDGRDYGRPAANRNLTLREAYDASVFWYYRETVRRIGPAGFKQWLDTVSYGNADTTGGFDQCWVRGGLRITPRQQIDFLRKLHDGQLPFSARTSAITKDIMLREDTLGHVMRAKTGWAMGDAGSIGWYVGWVEAPERAPYFFANRISTNDTAHATFAQDRIEIAKKVLRAEGVWP
ncbi:MAG: class D beta-lactamase [Flavobacteriales bacterium]|nr:class D beta-lactamase [Flavobacteriales bacterium]